MRSRIRTKLAAVALAVAASATLATAASPAAAATPTAVPGATVAYDQYCRVDFTLVTQWPGGAVVSVVVTNTSSLTVRWRLVIRSYLPVSGSFWNATVTQSGSTITVVPWPPSDVLRPGQSVMIGQLVLTGATITLPTGEVTCTPV